MNTHISKTKKRLIQHFHIALRNGGMMRQKPEILESFGVESTKDLTDEELQQAIDSLSGEADKWRKRVIAAIFGWCNHLGLGYDIKKVKAIACRATSYKRFNQIPVSRLRDLYYEFVRKSRTTVGAKNFKEEMINYIENRN